MARVKTLILISGESLLHGLYKRTESGACCHNVIYDKVTGARDSGCAQKRVLGIIPALESTEVRPVFDC